MSLSHPSFRLAIAGLILGVPVTAMSVSLEPTQSLSEDQSYQVATVDVDNDGDLDLVFGQFPDYVELWLNDGTGQFSNSGYDLGNTYTSSLYIVDANDDGAPDLFVGGASGYKEMSAQILVNNGSGNFTESDSVSIRGEDVGDWTVADVNADGHLDLVALTYDGSTTKHSKLSIWYGSDSGYTADPDNQHEISDYKCTALEAADLTGDSGDEIVAGCIPYTGNETEYAGGIQVWQHNGTVLTSLTSFLKTDWDIGDIEFIDINGDDHLDIVGTHFNSSTTVSVTGDEHSVWTNNNDGTFSPADLDFNGIALEIADVDGDGRDDLIIADGRNVRLELGESGVGFNYQAGAINNCDVYAYATAAGDFNGDAKIDLAIGAIDYSYTESDDLVLLQDGTGDLCPNSNTGGGSSGGGDDGSSTDGNDDDDSDTDSSSDDDSDSSGGGGAPGFGLMILLGLLSIVRLKQD